MPYEVYLYHIPKVSEDGKQTIPVPGSEEFDSVDDAKIFAANIRTTSSGLCSCKKRARGTRWS